MNDPLECPGCGRDFDSIRIPKLLKCGHCYCASCIPFLCKKIGSPISPSTTTNQFTDFTVDADSVSSKELLCPSCRFVTHIDGPLNVNAMPIHFGLLSASTQLNPLVSPRHTTEGICSECKVFPRKATAHCASCNRRFCELHRQTHGDQLNHDLRPIRRNSIPRLSVTVKCRDHNLEVSRYCYTCSINICNTCASKTHTGHSIEFISSAYGKMKDGIQADSQAVHDSLLVSVCESIAAYKRNLQEISSNATQVCQEIDQYFAILHQAIDDRKLSLLSEVESINGKKINKVNLQISSLLHLASSMNASCTLADSSLLRGEMAPSLAVGFELKQALELPRANIASMRAIPKSKISLSRDDSQEVARISSFGSLSETNINIAVNTFPSLSSSSSWEPYILDESDTIVVDVVTSPGESFTPSSLDIRLSLQHGTTVSNLTLQPTDVNNNNDASRRFSLQSPKATAKKIRVISVDRDLDFSSREGSICESSLVAVGGMTNHSTNSSGFEAYGFSEQKWMRIVHLPTGRCGLSCVSIDSTVYAIGGDSGANNHSRVVERFDGKWKRSSLIPTGRSGLSCASIGQIIYAIGGTSNSKEACCDVIEQFDSINNSWSVITNMTTPRYYHASCAIDSSLVVIGGSGLHDEILASVERLDLMENRWVKLAPLSVEKRALSCVCDENVIIVTGGRDNHDTCLPDVERLDQREGIWTPLTSCNEMIGRCAHGSLIKSNTLFCLGGCTDSTDWSASMDSLDLRNVGAGWTRLCDMNTGRCDFGCAIV